jgi:hypothetical protein
MKKPPTAALVAQVGEFGEGEVMVSGCGRARSG